MAVAFVAAESIVAEDQLYLGGSDYSCRAPLVKARTLVDFERANASARIDTAMRVSDWSFPSASAALGVPEDRELRSGFYNALIGSLS